MQSKPPKGGARGADYEVYEMVELSDWPLLDELLNGGAAAAAGPGADGASPTTPVPDEGAPSQASGDKSKDTVAEKVEKAAASVAPFSAEGLFATLHLCHAFHDIVDATIVLHVIDVCVLCCMSLMFVSLGCMHKG